jgi:hypothetical protein
MIPDSLHIVAIVSFSLAFCSAGAIAVDILRGRRQPMAVMNFVWPITALYFGPLALWAYWRLSRMSSGASGNDHSHRRPSGKPFWQSVFVGSTHCGAGCVLGDITGEWVVFATGLLVANSRLLADYTLDFALAYLAGIAFQYFAIVPMRHLPPAQGIVEAIKADTLSLVAFEVGMFGWMAVSTRLLFHQPLHPDSAVYWSMMQLGMLIGFITTFPANWFLIRRGIKAAM